MGSWWTFDVDAIRSDDMAAVCNEQSRKQSTSLPSNNCVARAQSVLQKLIRLSLTNRLTDDQTKAVMALGNQLFQTPGLMATPCRSGSAATRCWSATDRLSCNQQQSQASLLADRVVQRTVSQVRKNLNTEEAATAAQRTSTASMLADTVVQQTLREISNNLMTSDVLAPKAMIPDSATTFDIVEQIPQSSPPKDVACPSEPCTELTKYIVMNAIDIALSCARRAAAKRAQIDGKRSSVIEKPRDCQNPDSSLIDVFIDQLSSEVYENLSATARRPTSDAVLAVSRWIDDDLRCQCLAIPSTPLLQQSASLDGISPFAEVLMNLAIHDRLGDLQKNFVDGREMIELATCVLKSHVQSRNGKHIPADADKTSCIGIMH